MNTTDRREALASARESLRQARGPGRALFAGGALLALLGVGLALHGGLAFAGGRAEGTVVRLEPVVAVVTAPDLGGMGQPAIPQTAVAYYPVVEYEAEGGAYTYRSRWGGGGYSAGQKVPVVYRAGRPWQARIDSFADRWLTPLLLGGTIALLGAAVALAVAYCRWVLRGLEAKIDGPGEGAAR